MLARILLGACQFLFNARGRDMRISDDGVEFIKQWEGLVLEAYKDVAGVLTIGYGHTGTDVKSGMRITEERAEELLRADLQFFEKGVSRAIEGTHTRQNQFDALVSLAFNIGLGAFQKSTVLKRLKAGDDYGAGQAFTMWRKATINGKKVTVTGLLRRRRAEREMFYNNKKAPELAS